MANITYSNADKQNGIYTSARKIASAVDNWNKNPYFALGQMLGQAIFDPYFERKRNKSNAEANFMTLHPNATKDQFEQYYKAIKNGMSRNDALKSVGLEGNMREYGKGGGNFSNANEALDAYKNNNNGNVLYQGTSAPQAPAQANEAISAFKGGNGNVLYQGNPTTGSNGVTANNIPRTPAQANKPAVTTEQTGLLSPAAQYQNMANNATYNPGSTPVANPTGGNAAQIPQATEMQEVPVADAVPTAQPNTHGGSIIHGGGGAQNGPFQPIPEAPADAAPNLPVANNPYANFGYAGNAVDDFNNTDILQLYRDYLQSKQFNNSF